MTILVVDDNAEIRTLLGTRLKAEGYDVVGASTAKEALKWLDTNGAPQNSSIDLILMDILLPDIRGIEACRHIKANPKTKDIPIIMVTASSNINHLQEAFDAGAMDYLSKPFKKVELLARIRSAIRLEREIVTRKRHEKKLAEALEKLQQLNRRLEKLSSMDSLTGLYNRRFFDSTLQKEFSRAIRNGCMVSLIMIDIDEFKAFNDVYGHLAGDECLKSIADTFNRIISRSNDLVARYGGEEFCVILPDTCEQGAVAVAESLRRDVMKLDIKHSASKVHKSVTISLGVASLVPTRESQPAQLISYADQALYQSKANGRNTLTCAAIKN